MPGAKPEAVGAGVGSGGGDGVDAGAGGGLGLSVGDLLPLPHAQHRPFDLTVGGQTVASAGLGSSGSRLACVIVSVED